VPLPKHLLHEVKDLTCLVRSSALNIAKISLSTALMLSPPWCQVLPFSHGCCQHRLSFDK
jgi:hypothetical protein